MGGKFRSLKSIIPNFCEHGDFYDVFTGGGTIHLNTETIKVYANDKNSIVIDLQKYLAENDPERIYKEVDRLRKYYKADDKDSTGYKELRNEYNKDKDILKLLTLSQHSFNYLIRFNQQGGFNASHGKGISKLSQDYYEKLVNFKEQAERKESEFYNEDFRDFLGNMDIKSGDLVYCDPPYLLSEAVYNEKRAYGGWVRKDTLDLLEELDKLNDRNVYFTLSEMIQSKGKENKELIEWLNEKEYTVRYKNVKYLGVPSTHIEDKNSVEVLVTNY